jgi:hypothetical protein
MLIAGSAFVGVMAQSSSQEFPTPIISNELSGTIKARDCRRRPSDHLLLRFQRRTRRRFHKSCHPHLTGDLDVFTANGLKPLTKIVVYADLADSETGRAIYLRKPERLLLRIQGRTPNDEPATFRLKFAGSFASLRPEDVPTGPELPKVENQGVARVNSVGTLLPPPPKPVEPLVEKETGVAVKTEPTGETRTAETEKAAVSEEKAEPGAKLILTDPLATAEKADAPARRSTSASRRRSTARRTPPKPKAEEPVAKSEPDTETAVEKKLQEEKPAEANASAEERSAAAEKAAPEKTTTTPAFRTLAGRKRPPTPKKPAPESIPDPARFDKSGNSVQGRQPDRKADERSVQIQRRQRRVDRRIKGRFNYAL